MTLNITHPFVSTVPDDPLAAAFGWVTPTQWNFTHSVSGTLDQPNIGLLTATGSGISMTIGDQLANIYNLIGAGTGNILTLPLRNPILGTENIAMADIALGNSWRAPFTQIFSQVAPLSNAFTSGINSVVFTPIIGASTNKVSFALDSHFDATELVDPTFSNVLGAYWTLRTRMADASFDGGTDAKTTSVVLWMDHTAFAGGQRFVTVEKLHAYGMGDACFGSQLGEFSNGPLPGDEGIGFTAVNAFAQLDTAELAPISGVVRASGNTTTSQIITAALAAQEVSVVSTLNMNVNDWYVIQRMAPSPAYNAEAVKLTAVNHTTNTITAVFRNNHASGVTVTPALVMNNVFSNPGQLRVIVNRSGSVYTAGQVIGSFGAGALTGNATAWASNMVGGDSLNVGAISLVNDDYSVTGLRSWYEINKVDNPTQLEIVSWTVAGDASYRTSRGSFPSDYRIRPAVRILFVDLVSGKLICETTTTTWTNGDSAELVICPYPDITGHTYNIKTFTAGSSFRTLFSMHNLGPVSATTAISLTGLTANGQPTDKGYDFDTGIRINAASTGLSLRTITSAIELSGSAAAGHPGTAIIWADYGQSIDKLPNSGLIFSWNSGNIQTIPPATGINADANLSLIQGVTSWLQLTKTGGGALPYIKLDSITLEEATAFSVEVPVDAGQGWNARGSFAAAGAYSSVHSYGMGTNGVMQTSRLDVTLSNGANNDVGLSRPCSFVRIIGPTGAFSLSGIAQLSTQWGPGFNHSAGDGTELILYNSTSQAMTIINNGGGTISATAGFLTLTGADVVLAARPSAAVFRYSASEARWILIGTY